MSTKKQTAKPANGHEVMQRPYVDGKTSAHDWEAASPGHRCKVCGAITLDEMYLPRRNCHGKPA